jgi:hypothetical protein
MKKMEIAAHRDRDIASKRKKIETKFDFLLREREVNFQLSGARKKFCFCYVRQTPMRGENTKRICCLTPFDWIRLSLNY